MRVAALWLGLCLVATPAIAQERVGVRTGDHPGFGRIVFDWAVPPSYVAEQQGERVTLRFPNADRVDLSGARRLPRNVLAVNAVEGGIELQLRPGATMRHFRSGPRVAIDIRDPGEAPAAPAREAQARAAAPALPAAARPVAAPTPPASPATAARVAPPARAIEAAAPAPAPAETIALPPAGPLRPVATERAPAEAAPEIAPVPVVAPVAPRPAPAATTPPMPPSLAAQSLAAPRAAPAPSPAPAPVTAAPHLASLAGPAPIRARLAEEEGAARGLRLPVGGGVAAAALRRGEQAMLLLETERGVEFGALLREPAFAGIQAQRLPGALLITWPMAAEAQLTIRQDGTDWVVRPTLRSAPAPASTPTVPALRAEIEAGRAVLHAPRPGRVVSLIDPVTGLPLLVGLVGQAAPRQMTTRSLAEFDLLETFLGVAVLARADRVALRAGHERFLLSLEGGAVAMAQLAPDTAQGMTRSFDLAGQPVPALLERLRSHQAAVASAAPLLRGAPRMEAAQTLLALGLPQEAQAMLRIAAQENPQVAQDSRQIFLSGMAAILAGRAQEGRGLEAELPASDEIILWRALRSAMQGEAEAAAPGIAATLPLLLSYPDGLRRRLLAVAAEALVEGGQTAAARRLIEAGGDDAGLLLAQAMLEETTGDTDRALEAYGAAAASRDRLMRARALRRGVELRLANQRIGPAEAARLLEQTMFAWRGDALETSVRERIAELRLAGGDPRAALALLRETEAMFPERAAAVRPQIQASFLKALEMEQPLGAVGLYDAHPELMPVGEAGEAVLALLADRLAALDLADRAAGLWRRAMERAPPGEHRAALGARLAAQRLAERDAEGALAALGASSAPRLPRPLLETRSILAARAEARRGNRDVAVETLQALGPAGDETLADILIEARDHAGAAGALLRHLAAQAPDPAAPLPEALQRVALRGAALLAMAGDEPGLVAHRNRHAARITEPGLASAFEALTADPVRGLVDLPRLARELNLFRSFPQRLEPLRTAQRPAG